MGANLESDIQGINAAPSAQRTWLDPSGPLTPFLAWLGCGLFALSLPPVPDHGYQFYLGSRLLDGATLYVDVAAADMHPPLFTWMAAGLEAVGRLFGTSGLWLYPGFVVALAGVVLLALWRLGPRSSFVFTVLVIALLPLAGPYTGQGEHLALLLALPWLYATASGKTSLSTGARIALACAAGIGLAMKPHFALVWVGVEAYRAYHHGLRSLFRLEAVTIGAVFVAYVLATAVLTPAFFPLVPWLMALYPRFAPVPLLDVLLDARALLLVAGLAAAAFARRDPDWRVLTDVLAIAALVFYIAMLLQVKGWGYHWYPVNAVSVVLIALAARPHAERIRLLAPALAVAGAVWMNYQVDRTAGLLVRAPSYLSQTLDLVGRHAGGRPILALAQNINVGFPLVNYAGVGWASPYAHLWMIPALYDASWYRGQAWHYRETGDWSALEQEMFDRIWAAIERDRPGLILVEGPLENGFDMRSYFETDARFRALFARASAAGRAGHYNALLPVYP